MCGFINIYIKFYFYIFLVRNKYVKAVKLIPFTDCFRRSNKDF